MIKNLNILIIKIILLKLKLKTKLLIYNTSNIINTKFLYNNFFLITLYNYKFFSIFEKNQPFFKKTNNIFDFRNMNYFLFFRFFFFFIFKLKTKIILFNQVSINFLYKSKFIYFKSLNNFFSENKLNFYKNFNKIYKNFNFDQKSKNFFVLKKKSEHINPNFFLNYSNFLKPFKNFKKIKNSLNVFNFFNTNVIFFKKKIPYPQNHSVNIKILNKTISILQFQNGSFVSKYRLKHTTFFKKILKNKIKIKNLPLDLNRFILNTFKTKKTRNYKKNIYIRYHSILKLESYFVYKINFYFLSFVVFNFYKSTFNFKCVKNYKKKTINNFISKSKLACFNLMYMNNFYYNNLNMKNYFFLSNSYFLKSFKIVNNFKRIYHNNDNFHYYNNYYPVIYFNRSKQRFLSKFKSNSSINFVSFFNSYVLSFLESFFKKRFFLKPTNNKFHKAKHTKALINIYNNYKNYHPKYMKKFFIYDFLEIFWYSLYLKDLDMISSWLCNFLEKTHFRFHRKFILFFQNFFHKNENVFFNFLKIKGFFFDIRGKVGVAGNSKKRHFFFKTGILGKSVKKNKMTFKQSVVRTPSGALGLTLIISY